jgi:hypothetical protein
MYASAENISYSFYLFVNLAISVEYVNKLLDEWMYLLSLPCRGNK